MSIIKTLNRAILLVQRDIFRALANGDKMHRERLEQILSTFHT